VRFVLYGNEQQPYCSEVHYQRSLESLGHECRILQENLVPTDVVLREALHADALIWVHTHSFPNRGRMPMSQVLATLKTAGIPTIAMHLDLYRPLQRWQQYENSPYFRTEYWFTVDKLMADLMNEKGWTKAHFIPPGVLADECYISDQPSPHANDVIFVGAKTYHSEWSYRPQLIDWLRKTYGSRFTHIGPDGDTGTLRGDALNRAYANSKVAVGDTLCVNFDYPFYVSDRLFEAAGRGACQIFPRIKGIDEWYTEGKHLLLYDFGNFIDLRMKIDFLVQHGAEREMMRGAGHAHTKAHHTYAHRWQTILDTVFA
jgi:hypothetical protein